MGQCCLSKSWLRRFSSIISSCAALYTKRREILSYVIEKRASVVTPIDVDLLFGLASQLQALLSDLATPVAVLQVFGYLCCVDATE